MPRIARAVAKGYPHHVSQRGNYRQTVFEDNEDFIRIVGRVLMAKMRGRPRKEK